MKNKERYGLPEIYKFFKKKFSLEERNSPEFIHYDKFSSIIKDVNKEFARLVIEEAVELKLPLRLGFVRIKKYKKKIRLDADGQVIKKRLSINWQATKDVWNKLYPGKDYSKQKAIPELKEIHNKPLVYHLNEHTDGYGFMLYWNKKGSNAINRSIYSMVFTFSNNRHMAHVLKGDKKIDYYE